MRILIADDSIPVPPPPTGRPSAKLHGDIGGAVTMKYDLGRPVAVSAPRTTGVDADGCGPQEIAPPCPELDLQDQPEHLASALDALGLALLNRGCLKEGRQFIEQAFEIRVAYFGKDHPITAQSRNSRARALRMADELIAAGKEIDNAIKINRRVYKANSYPFAINLNERGAIELYLGQFRDAEKSALNGQDILRRLGLAGTDPNWTRLLDIQGRALIGRALETINESAKEKLLHNAERILRDAVNLDARQVGRGHPKYATHLNNLAVAEEMLGNLIDAATHLQEAIDVYDKSVKLPAHPNLIDMHANLGSVQTKQQDYTKAKDSLCKALGLNKQVRGPDDTLVGNDHANLGRLYFAMGNRDDARKQFEQARDIYKRNVKAGKLPRKHPYIREVEIWLDRVKKAERTARKSS